MTPASTSLKGAALIDFTESVPGCLHMHSCNSEFVSMLRNPTRPNAAIIIDRAVGGELTGPALVRDHLNLTGTNPLLGPNHPSGQRFPVVQGIYVEDLLPAIPRVVAAGIKPGLRPTAEDVQLIKQYGADVCCYNIVPAMLVAAHACCRVLAVLLPEGQKMPQDLLKALRDLAGEKA